MTIYFRLVNLHKPQFKLLGSEAAQAKDGCLKIKLSFFLLKCYTVDKGCWLQLIQWDKTGRCCSLVRVPTVRPFLNHFGNIKALAALSDFANKPWNHINSLQWSTSPLFPVLPWSFSVPFLCSLFPTLTCTHFSHPLPFFALCFHVKRPVAVWMSFYWSKHRNKKFRISHMGKQMQMEGYKLHVTGRQ